MGTLCKLPAPAPYHACSHAGSFAGGRTCGYQGDIGKPADYPLVEEQGNNIFIVNQKSGQLNFTAGHGLGDWVTNRLASGAIIDRMLSHGNYDMTSSDPLSGVYVKGEDDPASC